MSTDIRPELSYKNKWYIPKHRYYELKHFCLQYPEWKRNLTDLIYHGTSSKVIDPNLREWVDPVGEVVCYIDKYKRQIELLEKCARDTDPYLGSYILKAVTEGLSFTNLQTIHNIPCGKDMYYDRYRKFFYILSGLR